MNNINKEAFSVGALLYCPAINRNISKNIINEVFGKKYSLCVCLEDSISDSAVIDGENNILNTFYEIKEKSKYKKFFIPKIFIRVRNYKQIKKISSMLIENGTIDFLTGFNAPKFSNSNVYEYIDSIFELNSIVDKKIYMMPIIEDGLILNPLKRNEFLYDIKDKIDEVKKYILNIRVGGNDMCHNLSLRRNNTQTIYDINLISNILSDIYAVFHNDYVISGVVWDYFSGSDDMWKIGLKRELELDILNGFIGKTVIHPNQIEIVNEALKVKKNDYDDAESIINCNNSSKMVSKSSSGERMNEMKTHLNWAKKIIILSKIYGIK